MDITKYKNKNLICLKTGAKANIINYFDDQNASFVKVNINVKFNDTALQVLKTIELEERNELRVELLLSNIQPNDKTLVFCKNIDFAI